MPKTYALRDDDVPALIADWRALAARHAGTEEETRLTRLADQLEELGPCTWLPPITRLVGPEEPRGRRRAHRL